MVLKKTFGTYYAAFDVAVLLPTPPGSNAIPPGSNDNSLQTGEIFIGARFQERLLTNGDFYKALGFLKLSEIRASGGDMGGVPTVLKLKNSEDAQQLNVFRRYSVTLVPKDPNKTIPELGAETKTSFPASCALSEKQTRDVLYSKEFKFGEGPNAVVYVVLEDSMMRVHSKASAARIAKVNTVASSDEQGDQEQDGF